MKYIGGFIELESVFTAEKKNFHSGISCLQNGRACVNFIIRKIKPAKIFLPAWCCDSLVEPFQLNNIPFEFYAIDEKLMPVQFPDLKAGEYIVYINYAGICANNVDELYTRYGNRLIIDNTQAFFEKQYKDCFSFNSARKFFGVTDGAYLFAPENFSDEIAALPANENASLEHLLLRKQGEQEKGYAAFLAYEKTMNAALFRVSKAGEEILSQIDYNTVAEKRRANFNLLHDLLGPKNKMQFSLPDDAVPHYYPYFPDKKADRKLLAEKGIFIPVFWAEAKERLAAYSYEMLLLDFMLPLPVDQRYDADDMRLLAKEIG